MYRYLIFLTLLLITLGARAELPSISSANSSALQMDQEYRLGQAWVRMVRGRANLYDDPVVESYLQGLLSRLAPVSELEDQRLTLVLIDSAEVNAFAAPGGIIGINAGLMLAAQREDELASVIAHELAHLSQRHYAQQQAASERSKPLVLAGILGGILLSSISTDAGIAVMQGTVGATASTQLAFSRANETDADQAGMRTLVNAGFSATAMPRMFTRLQEVHRFSGNAVPEFLRTHPVTQNRIADTSNRALSMPQPSVYSDSTEFLIARARVMAHLADKGRTLEGSNQPLNAYILAVKAEQAERAESLWQQLNPALRQSPWLQLTRIEQLEAKQSEGAQSLKAELLDLYPDDYAVQRAQVDWALQEGRVADAVWVLRDLTREHPDNPELWYQLAEASGLEADRVGVHRARVEYFLVRGDYDLALRQLDFARRDARRQPDQLEWVSQRELEVLAQRDEVDRLFN